MKKKLTILGLLCILLVPTWAFAQGSVYGHFQVGSVLTQGGKSELAFLTSGDIPLSTDTAKNYMIVSRTGFFYQDAPVDQDNVKGAYEVIAGCKYFDVGKTRLNFLLGVGTLIEAQTGGETNTILKGEFGLTVWKSLTFSLGGDYLPINKAPDRAFVYVGLDITP